MWTATIVEVIVVDNEGIQSTSITSIKHESSVQVRRFIYIAIVPHTRKKERKEKE
jgi:hypothetical protein